MHSYTRLISYILIICALGFPLIMKYTIEPGRLRSAEIAFDVIENTKVKSGQIALVAFDFSPSTRAENESQARVILEHFFRKRIPVIVFTLVPLAEIFLATVPNEIAVSLSKSDQNQKWEYGKDWVNLGFRPGAALFLQGIGKSENLAQLFGKDINGTELNVLPAFKQLKDIRNIEFVAEFSGSPAIGGYIQFLQHEGYAPKLIYGPTSIMIPQSYIYLDSGQLSGLLEGISGAAWYAKLLGDKYGELSDKKALILNSSLGVAQLLVLVFIFAGNIFDFFKGLMR